MQFSRRMVHSVAKPKTKLPVSKNIGVKDLNKDGHVHCQIKEETGMAMQGVHNTVMCSFIYWENEKPITTTFPFSFSEHTLQKSSISGEFY